MHLYTYINFQFYIQYHTGIVIFTVLIFCLQLYVAVASSYCSKLNALFSIHMYTATSALIKFQLSSNFITELYCLVYQHLPPFPVWPRK